MGLAEYSAKRAFERTPEPAPVREGPGRGLRFVVHKHAARRMHYDLRLEMDGVLKSWAVPRGPSLDTGVRRMAIMVEDHPLAYGAFEGLIPDGNYGAGSVIIWDHGSYRSPAAQSEEENRAQLLAGLQKGNLKFVLDGERLHGEFSLVRTGDGSRSWLLIKKKDRFAGAPAATTESRSVVSHKSLEDMLGDAHRTGFGRRKENQIRLHEAGELQELLQAPVRTMPHGIAPMLAAAAEAAFDDDDWIYEVKWDGYRALAEISGKDVQLYSRNGISFAKRFAPVAESLRKIGADAVLDGEIVVLDERGQPDFQKLQRYQTGAGPLVYYVFDLLYFQGHDLTGLPLLARKRILRKMLPHSSLVRFSGHVARDGVLFFAVAAEKGLEGIIAKDSRSTYEAGSRTKKWLKIKTRRTQDAVIAGFTEPGGGRPYFGSLVLGVYASGRLVPIGNVGSGFREQDLREIKERLVPLITREKPFENDAAAGAQITWTRPELVCEVGLTGWTEDSVMRHPVFLRLREDKDAREVVREDWHRGGEGGSGP